MRNLSIALAGLLMVGCGGPSAFVGAAADLSEDRAIIDAYPEKPYNYTPSEYDDANAADAAAREANHVCHIHKRRARLISSRCLNVFPAGLFWPQGCRHYQYLFACQEQ